MVHILVLEKSELFFDNQMLQRSIAPEIPMRFLTLTQAHDPRWLWWHFFYLNGNSWVSGIWRKSSRHGGNLDGWSCSSVSLLCYFEVGVEERTNKPMTKLRVFNFQSFNFEIWRLSSQLTLLGIEALCSGWAVETIRVSPYSSKEPCWTYQYKAKSQIWKKLLELQWCSECQPPWNGARDEICRFSSVAPLWGSKLCQNALGSTLAAWSGIAPLNKNSNHFCFTRCKGNEIELFGYFFWRRWLHPGEVSAVWLAQWKTTLNVVISFLLHFESFLVSCFGDVFSTSDWSGLQAPWLEPGVFYVGKLHTPFPQNSTTCLRPDEECSEKKNIWCLKAQGVGWHEPFQRKLSEKCDSLKNTTWKAFVLKQLLPDSCPLVAKEVTRTVRPEWTVT